MSIDIEKIKQLREETGVSIGKCKEALQEAGGDMEKAREILKEFSAKAAAKKADRDLKAGVVQAYIHANNTVGVLVKLACETDFVAKNDDFLQLAKDIAMHIAAMNPETKEELLEQPFIKNPELTIQKLIEGAILKIGERIELDDYTRYEV